MVRGIGRSAVYPVNRIGDLLFGCVIGLIAALYTVLLFFFKKSVHSWEIMVLLMLVLGSAWGLASFFFVREIRLSDRKMSFLPIGVTVPLHDLVTIAGADYPGLGYIQTIRFRASKYRLRWVPGHMIWVREFVAIRTVGMDGGALHVALAERIGSVAPE
jgi:hypothetical protein